MRAAVLAEGLVKEFGEVKAVRGIDFVVEEGSVVGLLGPNGAGKTTVIRILTTLLAATAGSASVAGFDVMTQPQEVRAVIGLTGQYAAVDEDLTGWENLVLVGRLSHLGPAEAARRAGEFLEQFELSDAAHRRVRTYSGGMRRRLDLAASLVGSPAVLFLDEPTTGLDLRSRLALWEVIESLRAQGTTIVLTTQYLEEADRLADRISVIDGGIVIAEGTSDELKAKVGGSVLDLVILDRTRIDDVAGALQHTFSIGRDDMTVDPASGSIRVPVTDGASSLVDVVRRLDAAGVAIADLALHRPSLDDVFLALTGHRTDGDEGPPPGGRRPRRTPRDAP
jgi:ABC-2 type transport system ATP-binding protein